MEALTIDKSSTRNFVYRVVLGSESRVITRQMIIRKAALHNLNDTLLIDETLSEMCREQILEDKGPFYQKRSSAIPRRRKLFYT